MCESNALELNYGPVHRKQNYPPATGEGNCESDPFSIALLVGLGKNQAVGFVELWVTQCLVLIAHKHPIVANVLVTKTLDAKHRDPAQESKGSEAGMSDVYGSLICSTSTLKSSSSSFGLTLECPRRNR